VSVSHRYLAVYTLADFLGKKLDDYVATLPIPVYVIRMGQRSGLIRARLRGELPCCVCSL